MKHNITHHMNKSLFFLLLAIFSLAYTQEITWKNVSRDDIAEARFCILRGANDESIYELTGDEIAKLLKITVTGTYPENGVKLRYQPRGGVPYFSLTTKSGERLYLNVLTVFANGNEFVLPKSQHPVLSELMNEIVRRNKLTLN